MHIIAFGQSFYQQGTLAKSRELKVGENQNTFVICQSFFWHRIHPLGTRGKESNRTFQHHLIFLPHMALSHPHNKRFCQISLLPLLLLLQGKRLSLLLTLRILFRAQILQFRCHTPLKDILLRGERNATSSASFRSFSSIGFLTLLCLI